MLLVLSTRRNISSCVKKILGKGGPVLYFSLIKFLFVFHRLILSPADVVINDFIVSILYPKVFIHRDLIFFNYCLFFQELFRSDHYSHISPTKISGRCHVMSVKDFFKLEPEVIFL